MEQLLYKKIFVGFVILLGRCTPLIEGSTSAQASDTLISMETRKCDTISGKNIPYLLLTQGGRGKSSHKAIQYMLFMYDFELVLGEKVLCTLFGITHAGL